MTVLQFLIIPKTKGGKQNEIKCPAVLSTPGHFFVTVILRLSVSKTYSDCLRFNQQMLLQLQSQLDVQLLEQPLLLLPQQNQSTRRMMIIQQQLPPLPKLNPQFIEISPLNNVF